MKRIDKFDIIAMEMDGAAPVDADEDTWWFVCTVCYQAFPKESRFKTHQRTAHGSEPPSKPLFLTKSLDLEPKIRIRRCSTASTKSGEFSTPMPLIPEIKPEIIEEGNGEAAKPRLRPRAAKALQDDEILTSGDENSEDPSTFSSDRQSVEPERPRNRPVLRKRVRRPAPAMGDLVDPHEWIVRSGKRCACLTCYKDAFLRPSPFPGLWECKLCEERFVTQESIKQHVQRKHAEQKAPFPWKKEGPPSEWRAGALIVEKVKGAARNRPGGYECPFCKKIFTNSQSYQRHASEAHRSTTKRHCTVCDKVYASKKGLERHQADVHATDRPGYVCGTCGAKFKTNSGLWTHVHQVHEAERGVFLCDVCPKTFTTATRLAHHKIRHEEGRVMCPECGKMVKNNSRCLLAHRATHKDFRKYKCDKCDATFKIRAALYSHSFVHQDNRPISCPQCEKTFKSKASLKFHINCVHKTHTCRACSKNFPGPDSLRRHELEAHDLLAGPQSKRHKCGYCDKVFAMPVRLRQHEAMHKTDRPFTCETCGEQFKLDTHLRQHKRSHLKYEELPHVCDHGDECGRRFGTAAQLRNHKKRVHEPNTDEISAN